MKTVVFWTKEAGAALGHARAVEASSAEENRDKVENMLTVTSRVVIGLDVLCFSQREHPLIIFPPTQDLTLTPHFSLDQPRDILHGLIRPEILLVFACMLLCRHTPDIRCALYINGSIFGSVRTSIQAFPRMPPRNHAHAH